MSLHQNVPADPVNYNLLECVQVGRVEEANGTFRDILNVFHFGRVSGSSPPNFGGLAANVTAAIGAAVATCLQEDYESVESRWRPLDNPFVAESVEDPLWGSGLGSGDRSSTVDAWTVNILTGVRGRCFMGRKHFTPIEEASTDRDEIAAASLAGFTAAATALSGLLGISDGAGQSFNLVVFSRKSSVLTGSSIVLTWADMVDVKLQPTLGTMRRRKQRAV